MKCSKNIGVTHNDLEMEVSSMLSTITINIIKSFSKVFPISKTTTTTTTTSTKTSKETKPQGKRFKAIIKKYTDTN